MTTLGIEHNFLGIESVHSNLQDSKIAIVSAPYEHTVSYGSGTARGPEAILEASKFVEFYDDETDRELCFDVGIATLQPIAFQDAVDAGAMNIIHDSIDELLRLDKFVVTLGGEHTISQATVAAHLKHYPNMSVLQFDAHSDLRSSYEGSAYSHASVMARVCEIMSPRRITQVGIRAFCKEEAEFMKVSGINTYTMSAIQRGMYGSSWIRHVVGTLGPEVYITFDVDGLDPAIMPATGTPEPDGLLYHEAIAVIREIRRTGRTIVGLDCVELAPMDGLSHPNLTTARLIYKILNLAFTNYE